MSDKPLEGSCEGDKCLVGYIRRNHLADYNKKGSFGIVKIFEKLTHTDMIHSALINAAWLQAQQHTHLKANDNKPYLINPYTTVDALVKRLLGIQEMIKWVELGELVKTSHFMLIFEIISENSLKITFTNQRKTSFILNQKYIAENCYCLDNQNIRYRLNLEIPFNLSPNETGFCLLTLPEGNWRSLNLHFKIDEHHIILSL